MSKSHYLRSRILHGTPCTMWFLTANHRIVMEGKECERAGAKAWKFQTSGKRANSGSDAGDSGT